MTEDYGASELDEDSGGRGLAQDDRLLARAAAGAFAALALVAILGARADHMTEAARLRFEAAMRIVDDTERSAALEATHRALSGRLATGNLAATASAVALALAPPNLDRAEETARGALSRGPAKADAWARLAFVDVARDGQLGEDGRAALMNSYLVAPYGPEAFQRWRLEFTLALWSQLDENLRTSALRQASVIEAADGGRAFLEGLVDTTPDQAGSLALGRHLSTRDAGR